MGHPLSYEVDKQKSQFRGLKLVPQSNANCHLIFCGGCRQAVQVGNLSVVQCMLKRSERVDVRALGQEVIDSSANLPVLRLATRIDDFDIGLRDCSREKERRRRREGAKNFEVVDVDRGCRDIETYMAVGGTRGEFTKLIIGRNDGNFLARRSSRFEESR